MISALRLWPLRAWTIALVSFVATLVVSGIPTGIVPSTLYHRMTPVLWWNYPIWIVSALLLGLLAGSYFSGMPLPPKDPGRHGVWGEFISFIAIGCPICNKIVVALLGVSGALSYFAPLQPILGIMGVALLVWTVWLRLRNQTTCTSSLLIIKHHES